MNPAFQQKKAGFSAGIITSVQPAINMLKSVCKKVLNPIIYNAAELTVLNYCAEYKLHSLHENHVCPLLIIYFADN